MLTPRKPPVARGAPPWKSITPSTATARIPSSAGTNPKTTVRPRRRTREGGGDAGGATGGITVGAGATRGFGVAKATSLMAGPSPAD